MTLKPATAGWRTLGVAIARVFNSALAGNSKDRPELVSVPLPLTARIAALPCRGGEEFVRRLFEPLGYGVSAEHHPLDEKFPEWGETRYYTVEVAKSITLQDLLTHLYVLIPVLDADKHYWVGKDEVEKLPATRRGMAPVSAPGDAQRNGNGYVALMDKTGMLLYTGGPGWSGHYKDFRDFMVGWLHTPFRRAT